MLRVSRNWLLLGILFIAGLAGCQPPQPIPVAAAANDTPGKEYWDAIFFEDSKVGYSHTTYQTVTEGERQLVKISAESELLIQRFGQSTQQQLRYTSVETPGGEVIRFDSSMSSGDPKSAAVSLEASGEVRGDEIECRLTTVGKTKSDRMPWNKEWGGFFAIDQSLEKSPLKPQQTRTLRALTPGFNQTADIELIAKDQEAVQLLDESRELLRVQCKITLDGNVLEQVLWTDPSGQIIKSFMPTLKQATYRTTKEKATSAATGSFDLGEKTIVKVDRELERPHQTKRVVYRATIPDVDALKAFASGATQLVRSIDQHEVEIVVRALHPGDELGTEFPADSPPVPDDLSPNPLIQSDDERVVAMAREVAADKTEHWGIAIALEQHVRQSITEKNFSQALSSAAQVAQSREGDCTEHAVLLAALCRARGIPSRVVIGLVYHRASGGFAFHMWTEAWITDRWIPLDATLGLGGIGAGHLAVSHSNLKGSDPLTQFLPVLQLIGNLKLKIVSVN